MNSSSPQRFTKHPSGHIHGHCSDVACGRLSIPALCCLPYLYMERSACIKFLWVMLTPIRANKVIVIFLLDKVMVKLNPRLSESLWILNNNSYSHGKSCENPSICQNYCTTCLSVGSWFTVMRVIHVGHTSDILSHKIVPFLRKS